MRRTGRRFRPVNASALDAAMTAQKVSEQELADALGCSKALIGHLRRGLVQMTAARRAARIEDHLGAPPGTLFGAARSASRTPGQQRE